jgi:hypothetical protein
MIIVKPLHQHSIDGPLSYVDRNGRIFAADPVHHVTAKALLLMRLKAGESETKTKLHALATGGQREEISIAE